MAIGQEGYCDGGMPGCERSPTWGAVVGTSIDGITWSKVQYDAAVFGRDADPPAAFMVSEDLLIATRDNIFGSSRRNSFNSAFHQWLKDTYPDVLSESGFEGVSGNGPGFDSGNPDLMIVAVEYVKEFVAQSDTYPLDPSDQ